MLVVAGSPPRACARRWMVPAMLVGGVAAAALALLLLLADRPAGATPAEAPPLLGLAYKRDLGDLRESPAPVLIRRLESRGALVRWHDPYVRVHLPHPGHPVGEGDGLDGGGADQDGQPLAAVLGGADEVVMAGVRRIELAEHEPVTEPRHPATSANSRCET